MRKPFSEKLYNDNDDAKYLVIEWLDEQGYDAIVNPDKYGIDLLAVNRHTKRKISVEVEVKKNWSGDYFPFESVHFAERKRDMAGPDTFFMMLNARRTRLLVVSGTALLGSPIVKKDTVYTENEKFIEVPKSRCMIYLLEVKDGKPQ